MKVETCDTSGIGANEVICLAFSLIFRYFRCMGA